MFPFRVMKPRSVRKESKAAKSLSNRLALVSFSRNSRMVF